MDFFSKHKFTTVTIIVLVILNLFTLSLILIREFRKPEPPFIPTREAARPDRVMFFLQRELDLTEEQAKQFIQLRRDHFAEVQNILKDIQDIKKTMMDELFAGQPDEQKLEALAQQIGEMEGRREMLVNRHFMELKAVCRPEQREKLQHLLHRVIHREQRLERRHERMGRRGSERPLNGEGP
jgi:periplasmic protein CpxP/Spy